MADGEGAAPVHENRRDRSDGRQQGLGSSRGFGSTDSDERNHMSSWLSACIVDRAHPVIGATVISPAVVAAWLLTGNISTVGA
jgi:hypothetical protein